MDLAFQIDSDLATQCDAGDPQTTELSRNLQNLSFNQGSSSNLPPSSSSIDPNPTSSSPVINLNPFITEEPSSLPDGCMLSRPSRSEADQDDDVSIDSQSTQSLPGPSLILRDLEEYPMDNPRRGLCYIFNHEKFKIASPRAGTTYDAYVLRKCFSKLGFEVVQFDDLTKDEIFAELEKASNTDHSDADSFVCCILTHGERETLQAHDLPYSKDEIFQLFDGNNCKSLIRKPKLFIIQACRGTKHDKGSILDVQTDSFNAFSGEAPAKKPRIPNPADFLIYYSTSEGYYSYRNTAKGSWCIQALAPLVENHGHEYNFHDILLHVNHQVAFNKETDEQFKQMPQVVHTLTKKLIFRPKSNQPTRSSTIAITEIPIIYPIASDLQQD